jgi:hypothetical protein
VTATATDAASDEAEIQAIAPATDDAMATDEAMAMATDDVENEAMATATVESRMRLHPRPLPDDPLSGHELQCPFRLRLFSSPQLRGYTRAVRDATCSGPLHRYNLVENCGCSVCVTAKATDEAEIQAIAPATDEAIATATDDAMATDDAIATATDEATDDATDYATHYATDVHIVAETDTSTDD